MEHNNAEKEIIIRKKIIEAEQQVVVWGKTEAWKKIELHIQPGPQKYSYFYYAAAVISFFILFFLALDHYYFHRHLVERINTFEQDVLKAEERILNSHLQPFAEETVCFENVSPVKVDLADKQLLVNKSKPKTSLTVAEQEPGVEQESGVFAKVEVPIETEVPAVAVFTKKGDTHTVDRIEPIIGVFEAEKEMPAIAHTRKKNRIKIFRNQEEKFSKEDSNNKLIIARIK